jgi:hypothetical protein
MPLSFDAFSSKTASLKLGPKEIELLCKTENQTVQNNTIPKRIRARQRIVVVLPTPGGP